MTAIKKKPKATKCSDHCTVSLITHIAKTAVRMFRIRTERKLRMCSEKISFKLEKEKELKMQSGCLE
jgi:hypothetical protein